MAGRGSGGSGRPVMNEGSMRGLNLVFRFVLELVVLVALFLWGVSVSGELIVQVVLGLGAPAIALTVWGLFVAPKASRRLPDPQRLAVEIVVFGAGVLAFLRARGPAPGAPARRRSGDQPGPHVRLGPAGSLTGPVGPVTGSAKPREIESAA